MLTLLQAFKGSKNYNFNRGLTFSVDPLNHIEVMGRFAGMMGRIFRRRVKFTMDAMGQRLVKSASNYAPLFKGNLRNEIMYETDGETLTVFQRGPSEAYAKYMNYGEYEPSGLSKAVGGGPRFIENACDDWWPWLEHEFDRVIESNENVMAE